MDILLENEEKSLLKISLHVWEDISKIKKKKHPKGNRDINDKSYDIF